MADHPYMALSTIAKDGRPQTAIVGFGQTENLELIFGTPVNTRKAKNITKDPRISSVIGWDMTSTLQYEGEAHLLEGDDIEKYTEIYFEKKCSSPAILRQSW